MFEKSFIVATVHQPQAFDSTKLVSLPDLLCCYAMLLGIRDAFVPLTINLYSNFPCREQLLHRAAHPLCVLRDSRRILWS